MPSTLSLKPCVSASTDYNWRQPRTHANLLIQSSIKVRARFQVVAMGMLSPGKLLQTRSKVRVFKDKADEAHQKNWWRLMQQIEDTGSAVSVLRSERMKNQILPRDLILGTLVRFKQLKKWNLVSEILEWLRTQHWWDFNQMDCIMLMTAYGKQGNFNSAEKFLSLMNKKGYALNVVSHTALMEAYGRGGRYNNAEAIFRRMLSSGPDPSALTCQIMLSFFVEANNQTPYQDMVCYISYMIGAVNQKFPDGFSPAFSGIIGLITYACLQANKFDEAEEFFETLLKEEKWSLKADQKMFHMMIYMYKKAGNYQKARQIFALMAERGVPRSTVTYNSLMSFDSNYKEVSKIYDQMQRSGLRPDVISYASLINAYGKARREDEALAVFREMLAAGVRPTRKAYNILLNAFAILGMVEQARTIFKSMRRDRCNPDICSYTTMLSAYVNASDMDGAEKFFKRVKQDGLEPNVVTYGTLIKGYAKVNNLEKMMEKYEEMRLSGMEANQTILTTIMDAHGKNKDFGSAVIWYKQMEQDGVPPDQKAKNILLCLAKTEEDRKEANQLTRNLEDFGIVRRINKDFRSVEDEDEDDEDVVSSSSTQQGGLAVLGDHLQNLEGLHTLNAIEL